MLVYSGKEPCEGFDVVLQTSNIVFFFHKLRDLLGCVRHFVLQSSDLSCLLCELFNLLCDIDSKHIELINKLCLLVIEFLDLQFVVKFRLH